MYKFRKVNKSSEYRLYSNQVFDKENCYVYYKSYMAYADDLNKSTQAKIRKHKDTIDFAIKYVDSQYKAGFNGYSQIVFPQSLNKLYYRTVYQFVRALHRKDREQKHYLGSQPYWINDKMIVTNGYRSDDKATKFQMFVEFIPSYQSNSENVPIETIKLNLTSSKQLDKNIDILYQDGFDLVYRPEGSGVRFVTEKIVTKVQFDGKEQFILIDGNGTIWESTVDKSKTNDAFIGQELHYANSSVKKRIRKLKAFKSTKNFYKRIEDIKQKVSRFAFYCVNKEKATRVHVLYNVDTHSNVLAALNEAFITGVEDKCKFDGIECKIVSVPSDELATKLTELKRQANQYAKSKGKYKAFRRTLKHKWSEFLLVLMQKSHNKFPRLFDCTKYCKYVKKLTVKSEPDSYSINSKQQDCKDDSPLIELPVLEFV